MTAQQTPPDGDRIADLAAIDTPALRARQKSLAARAYEIIESHRAAGTDPSTSADWETIKSLLSEADEIQTAIAGREAVAGAEDRIKAMLSSPRPAALGDALAPGISGHAASLADQLLESEAYKASLVRTSNFSNLQDWGGFQITIDRAGRSVIEAGHKTLVSTGSAVGGPLIVPMYSSDVDMLARPEPTIVGMVRRVPIRTDTVYWVTQTARSSVATAVPEATSSTGTTGTKPEATITFARRSTSTEYIAVTAAITEQQLADAGQTRAIIDEDLRSDLMIQLESQILSGSGTAPNLTGILNAGIQTVAFSTAVGNILDNLLRAQTVIVTADEPAPGAYVVNPVDWERMAVLKAAGSGEYFIGTGPGSAAPLSLWGLPVVRSTIVPAGTALVGAFRRACTLYDREQVRFVVGWVNDDLYRNIIRIRAEMRVAFVVHRPDAIARITGI